MSQKQLAPTLKDALNQHLGHPPADDPFQSLANSINSSRFHPYGFRPPDGWTLNHHFVTDSMSAQSTTESAGWTHRYFENIWIASPPDEDTYYAWTAQGDCITSGARYGVYVTAAYHIAATNWPRVASQLIDLPAGWQFLSDPAQRPDMARDGAIFLEHSAGYIAEIWRRYPEVARGSSAPQDQHGVGKWDVEYIDLKGARRDGSDTFHDSPQEAIDVLAAHIDEVMQARAEEQFQVAEMEAVEWPQRIGRFTLSDHSSSHAIYKASYIRKHTILGKNRASNTLKIRFYEDTSKYHIQRDWSPDKFDTTAASRKCDVITAARDQLAARTKTIEELEQKVLDSSDTE